MLMQAGQNPNAVRKHDLEDCIRKARDERAPSLAVSWRAGQRMLSDEVHDEVERSAEPTSEADLPRLIPSLNSVNLAVGEPAKNDRQAHRLRSRDKRTSGHGRSSEGFEAASASRRSISARCSSVTDTEADSATTLSQMAWTSSIRSGIGRRGASSSTGVDML
jgi:hypothetical protein